MLEKAKDAQFGVQLQSKITRKLTLCQKLQSFFDESKNMDQLRSIEYLSTSLMISAKIFENEENIKTFNKHSRICSRSVNTLQSIELKILEQKKWLIDHSSIYDFGIHFMSNYLFRNNDLVFIDKPKSNSKENLLDLSLLIESQIFGNSCQSSTIKNILKLNKVFGRFKTKSLKLIQNISIPKKEKILKKLQSEFSKTCKNVLIENNFKSSFKIIFVTYLMVFFKQFFFGNEYLIFYFGKERLCNNLKAYILYFIFCI